MRRPVVLEEGHEVAQRDGCARAGSSPELRAPLLTTEPVALLRGAE